MCPRRTVLGSKDRRDSKMHRKYIVRIITHRGIVAGHFRTYARTPTWPCADSSLRANAPSAERSARRVACGGDPAPSVSTRPRHRNPGLRAPFRVPFVGPEGTSSASVLVTSKAPAPGLRPGSSVLSERGLKAAHAHARPGKAGSCSSTPRRARAGGTAAWLRCEPEVLAEVPGPRPRLGDSPPRPPRWAPGAAPGSQGARLGSAPQPRQGSEPAGRGGLSPPSLRGAPVGASPRETACVSQGGTKRDIQPRNPQPSVCALPFTAVLSCCVGTLQSQHAERC